MTKRVTRYCYFCKMKLLPYQRQFCELHGKMRRAAKLRLYGRAAYQKRKDKWLTYVHEYYSKNKEQILAQKKHAYHTRIQTKLAEGLKRIQQKTSI